jgi:hypothetical protein
MSQEWANRQRRTNGLVRLVAARVLTSTEVTSEQLYGLCKLTWITESFDGNNPSYITSTKIPALGNSLARDYETWSLSDVADDVANVLGSDDAKALVLSHTGFTNFYKPYRNSCRAWLKENQARVEDLFRRTFTLASDNEGLEIARAIKALPHIPKANIEGSLVKPEYLLTPTLFALDRRIRFPLINGNEGVRALLSALRAAHVPLDEQYSRMIRLYGQGGIQDAADLDQVGRELPDFIRVGLKPPTKELLQKKPVEGNALPTKDEVDIESLQKTRTVIHRRLHNVLTNALRERLASFTLLEGCDESALFDVLVKNYNASGDDLLIEAKSSSRPAQIRMAVGQLFDYWFNIKGTATPHLAILTQEKPGESTIEMLDWLHIAVLWLENGLLKTCSERLQALCDN